MSKLRSVGEKETGERIGPVEGHCRFRVGKRRWRRRVWRSLPVCRQLAELTCWGTYT